MTLPGTARRGLTVENRELWKNQPSAGREGFWETSQRGSILLLKGYLNRASGNSIFHL